MLNLNEVFLDNLNFSFDIQRRYMQGFDNTKYKNINDNQSENNINTKILMDKDDFDKMSLTTNEKDKYSTCSDLSNYSIIENLFSKKSMTEGEENEFLINDEFNKISHINRKIINIKSKKIQKKEKLDLKIHNNIIKLKKIKKIEKIKKKKEKNTDKTIDKKFDKKIFKKMKKIKNFWSKTSKSLIQIFKYIKIEKNNKNKKKFQLLNKKYNTRSKRKKTQKIN